jgi:hypothetical protein
VLHVRDARLPVLQRLTQTDQLLLKVVQESLDPVKLLEISGQKIRDSGIFVRGFPDIAAGDSSIRQPAFMENLHGDPYPCCARSARQRPGPSGPATSPQRSPIHLQYRMASMDSAGLPPAPACPG